jgi:hypothetical protein
VTEYPGLLQFLEALLDLGDEPILMLDHALHRFHHQSAAIAALLFGKAAQPGIQFSGQLDLHG